MSQAIREAINAKFSDLKIETRLRTPDIASDKWFSITEIDLDKIKITLNSGSPFNISKESFYKVMLYLIQNNHNYENSITINSDNNHQLAGPLCIAARKDNNNIRCINYILPILKEFGFVEILGTRPNTCWYL